MGKRFQSALEDSSVEEPLINLTPLIDVVFVVLITFMLIAPILDIDSVELASSAGTEKKEMEMGPFVISVHADNSLWFKGKKISLSELEKLVKQEKKLHPGIVPQILHDKKAQFGTYQMVKNALEIGGFDRMDVILIPGQ